MKNLGKIIDKIEKNIDDKDRIRERALRSSREIIIGCRKAIQCIHQDLMKDSEKYIKKASGKLLELYDKAIEAFVEARSNYTEETLKNTFKSPFGREMTYEDWFGFIIHHTIGHIYQSFRLQAIYLRHKV